MIRAALVTATLLAAAPAIAGECIALFDGETLDGWQALGPAEYEVRDGTIIGRAVDDTRNSFLRTENEYGDFTLTLKFRFDPNLGNSGVQFRSAVYEAPTDVIVRASGGEYQRWTAEAGRVHGYQAEIDPRQDRGWTAEIYDEAARGWLRTHEKEPRRKLVAPDTWYTLKIRAAGDHIRTWLDGEPIADLRDGARAGGFIALQVHGVNDASQVGAEIAFKDIELCAPD